MSHLAGEGQSEGGRLEFDRRVRVEFHGSTISSDGGLLLYRELDDVLGLHELMGEHVVDTRNGHNRLHSIVALSRQSIFGRLAGYEDVNDADYLAVDPVMRQIVGGRAVDHHAASASQMGRFETEVLARSMSVPVVVDLWGSATMRTAGEEFAMALWLIGVVPTWDTTSDRVAGFERLGRGRVRTGLRLEPVPRVRQGLDVVRVRVGGDQHPAL